MAKHRPRQHGRSHRGHRGRAGQPEHRLRRHGFRRSLQDHERRREVDAALRASRLDLNRRHRAGAWQPRSHLARRTPWTHTSGDERGGLFRSVDGGRTWKKLEGGLPKVMGRVGIAVAASSPNVVYAITEAKEGTLWRSDDRGDTWRNVSKQTSIVSRGFYYTHVRVDPQNENRVFAVASTLFLSVDGGRTVRPTSGRPHPDFHP